MLGELELNHYRGPMPFPSQRPKTRPESDSFTVHGVSKPIVSSVSTNISK